MATAVSGAKQGSLEQLWEGESPSLWVTEELQLPFATCARIPPSLSLRLLEGRKGRSSGCCSCSAASLGLEGIADSLVSQPASPSVLIRGV